MLRRMIQKTIDRMSHQEINIIVLHQNTESDTVKELPEKKKNKKRGGKKLAETISLAIVFGLVAGAVFQGVNFASEKSVQ